MRKKRRPYPPSSRPPTRQSGKSYAIIPSPQPHYPAATRRPPTATLARRHLSPNAIAALLDGEQRRAFDALRQLSAQTATPTYLVGGPVRDALLGAPLVDLDFAIEGNAPALAQQLAEHLAPNARLTIHPRFATATITLPPSTGHPADNIDFFTECGRRGQYHYNVAVCSFAKQGE